MARPNKQGLDYFPLDVDFFEDEKILAISGEFAVKGEIIVLRLLCEIYRNGYFVEYSELLKNKLARLGGLSGGLVDEVVSKLVKYGFFDGSLFSEKKILTSIAIQKRFFEVIKRRKNIEATDYLLLKGVNVYINPAQPELMSTLIPKGKESKVKNIEVTDVTSLSESLDGSPTQSEAEIQSSETTPKEKDPPIPAHPPVNYRDLVIFFNSETKGVFGEIRHPISEKRKESIRARIREYGRDAFAEMIRKAARSDFLKGANKQGFKASFDWLIKPSNFPKVLEGNYENRTNGSSSTPADDAGLVQSIAQGYKRGLEERERKLRNQ